MNTLQEHTLVYDDECPMCREYSKAFVKTGMLDEKGREAFTEVNKTDLSQVDWNRARNEIALINRADRTVRYGVDSLIAIFENSFPSCKAILRFKPVNEVLKPLYFFISYNRKVIAPGRVFEGNNKCTPDMNYGYRVSYIFLAWVLTSFILVKYFALGAPIIPTSGFTREFLVCAGQLLFQGVIVYQYQKDRVIHYLGNVMTVSLLGGLALSPMVLLAGWITNPWIFISYFMVVVSFMFIEHKRRVKILELPVLVSYSWVLYRLLILFTVLL